MLSLFLAKFGPVALVFLVALVAVVVRAVRGHQEGLVLRAAAARLGLQHERAMGVRWGRRLFGERDGVYVTVSTVSKGGGRSRSKWVRYEAAGPHPDLRLVSRTVLDDLLAVVTSREVKTGAATFDDAIAATGDAQAVRASLPADTRARVESFFTGPTRMRGKQRRRVVVKDGTVVLLLRGRADSADAVVQHIDEVVQIARALTVAPADVRPRLLALAAADPEPEMRRAALAHLGELPIGPDSEPVLTRALTDRHPAVRARAAVVLGDPEGLRRAVADPLTPPAERAAAVATLETLGLAAPGRVALADADGVEGALSEAVSGGEVTLPDT